MFFIKYYVLFTMFVFALKNEAVVCPLPGVLLESLPGKYDQMPKSDQTFSVQSFAVLWTVFLR